MMLKTTCFVSLLAASGVFAAAPSLTGLRCEYLENPIGVETMQPRLSWVLESPERGVAQSAWQILAASDAALLEKDQSDLWDSGKVASDQSVQVSYQGKLPDAGKTCYWKARVWDQSGKTSTWSRTAEWTTGLAKPQDWKARWIGAPSLFKTSATVTLDGLPWIWLGGSQNANQAAGTTFFRKELTIPTGRVIQSAKFLLVADDELQLSVNGEEVGPRHTTWKKLAAFDLSSELRAGSNVLGLEVKNGSDGPAGLLGKLTVVFTEGGKLEIPIDESWLTAGAVRNGWNTDEFTAGDWKPASVVARYGDQPWGKPAYQQIDPASYYRKPFAIGKPVRRATVFASALGAYELRMNGAKVDTDELSPGWVDFHKRAHYFGYDVTKHLKQGDNVIGAILGDGWFASHLAFTGKRHYYGGDPRLLVQLRIDYQDGSSEIIGTDDSWKCATGPILEGDLLMGCVYDARLEMPGWDAPGFDKRNWYPPIVDEPKIPLLTAHPGKPIRRMAGIPAKKVTEPKPGVYVFDLGQNMVGFARVTAKGKPGGRIRVRHAEMLNPDGTIYTTNLRAAAATDTYFPASTEKRAYEPAFTFHGFQYVEVTGLDYKPEPGDVTGIVLHSDLARTGWFECSEPLVNKLTENSLWGQKSNFLDVPTDCPQRDERAGWTGDAQVFMKTACLNMDAPAFYTKWLRDLCTDSQREDGAFGDVAPHLDVVGFGNTGWTDAGPVCAWRMFEMYGDTRVLEEHYPALIRHMAFLSKTSKDHTRGTGAFGDWLRLSGPQHSDAIGTAYYAYTARTMAAIAQALGKTGDAAKYRELHEQIRQAFVRNFIKPDGQIIDDKNATGQTFYALAFGLDLVPAEMKAKTAGQFADSIAKENGHIATGFLGTPFILSALQNAGHPELAYQLVLNKTYPSWLQQVIWGSTTMWERWDGWRPDKGFQDAGMNSFNHYWLGCVSEWLITRAAGIDTDGPGFQQIVIRPEIMKPGTALDWVNATYQSIRGPVKSSWKIDKGALRMEVTIPANSRAVVHIPAKDPASVTEGKLPAERSEGVKFLRMEDGRALFEIGSGSYVFTSPEPFSAN